VLAHNVETVPRLYKPVRPGSVYERSLRLLSLAKDLRPDLLTKSGLMLGLGETNDEVLAVNQDPLGKQAVPIRKSDEYEIWAKDLENGCIAIGLFNKTERPIYVPVEMKDLQADGKWSMRDAWSQTDLGKVRGHFEMRTRPHGARMVVLTKQL